jgi:hypothetical protein
MANRAMLFFELCEREEARKRDMSNAAASTPRTIDTHKVNHANDVITLTAVDQPGSGGANHHYEVEIPADGQIYRFNFQNGPINEVGVNGLTHEVLLAILIDRLEGFQSGAYANDFNQAALEHLQAAQQLLQARTKERMARGVEGTHQQ